METTELLTGNQGELYGLRPVIVVSKDKLDLENIFLNKKITIAGEEFYVVGANGDRLRLITAYNVDTSTYTQNINASNVEFDDEYETEDEGDEYENATIKTLVDNYVSALQTRWGKSIANGSLMNIDDFYRLEIDKSLDLYNYDGTYYTAYNYPEYISSVSPYWVDMGRKYTRNQSSTQEDPSYIIYDSDTEKICCYGYENGVVARIKTCYRSFYF